MEELIKEYLLSSLGVLLTALGLVIFLIPHNIAAGGASGLAIVLNKLLPLSVGIWMYIVNAVLFLVAFLIIGFDFSFKTIYCTFLLNFLIDLFDRIVPIYKYHGEEVILAVFFGDILTAIGMAIAFSQNASTGGTDIIAKILNKFFGAPFGLSILFIDFAIGISAGLVYNIDTGLYSILAIIVNGTTIDFVLKGLELSVNVWIISDKHEEIKNFVTSELERGCTVFEAKGGYTNKERIALLVVLKRRELHELVNAIRRIDPRAFFLVNEARQVYGEGFKEII
ncbi:YitT family protein [Fervidobacterium islandicum]|uniref:YitT family protein n=1 Tax=Fervidobacterium islandicum TaxID=2423 RepID=A0AAI8GDR8_FERIS|nr:YitT family protein [Fervidobacterium islandicum]AMW33650.1 YitT family protein [Fervidobacterium islandicum]